MHSSRMRTANLLPVSHSMHCAGGVCSKRGVCSGGCLLQGVAIPRRVVALRRGCLLLGRGCLLQEWGCLSQHALRQTPPPPCEQND